MSRLLKIRHNVAHVQRHDQQKARAFDQDSGQVYTEVLRHSGPMTSDWVRKTIGSTREVDSFRSRGPGCSSLVNMAIRNALTNILSITPESLREMPWEIGKRLWERILAYQLDSVYIFTVFVEAYGNDLDQMLQHKHHIVLHPNMSLADYTKPTVSLSLRWITFLTLSNVICSRTDLVKLSQLTNLGALTIGKGVGCPESNFDDGIIRSWSRAATEADAFSMLRVLTCCSQKDITTKSFVYLKQFPSLTFFNVEDCDLCSGDQMKIETLGWKSKTLKGLGPWLQIGRGVTRGWDLTIRACFQHGRALHLEDQTVEAILATDLLPVLHLSLGDYDLDAEFNMGGDKIMKCFRRLIHPKARPAGSTRSSKRTPNELENSREVPRKKMMIRASKKHNLEDLLTSLGT